jgi:curved DNA-binding protein CbpA
MAKSEKSRADKIRELRSLPRIDPWAIFGLERGASDADIKRAYRRLAREHHPDKHRGKEAEASARFKEVAAAYEVLRDPEKRVLFEQMRWQEDAPPAPTAAEDYYSYAPRSRRPWNRFVRSNDGVPHYHAGNVATCTTCGMGLDVTSLNNTVVQTSPQEGSGTLPGGAFSFAGVK